MNFILIDYIAFVNLAGLMLMWYDKRAARRHGKRIPERVLIGIAVIGGSIGVLLAVYLLRHKTRHLSFTVGVPLILLAQLLLAGMLSFKKHQDLQGPSTAVRNELTLIQELDDETISGILSYEHLMPEGQAGPASDEAAEAIRSFFGNFSFRMGPEKTGDREASVTVDITNIDMRALSCDLRTSLTKTSLSLDPAVSVPASLDNYFSLLKETLDEHKYDTAVTQAVFHLTRTDDEGWVIDADEKLEDELVSHFITYMNDPYLIPAEDVLDIWLEQFSALTPEEWIDWLHVSDLFATGSETYAPQIDEEYFSKLTDAYSSHIDHCEEDGDLAKAEVTFTSVDLSGVLEDYRSALVAYAGEPGNITNGASQLTDDSAAFLLEALRGGDGTKEMTTEVTLRNNGQVWKPELDEQLIDAMCGGLAESLAEFSQAAESD